MTVGSPGAAFRRNKALGTIEDSRTRVEIGRFFVQWNVHDALIPHVMGKLAAGRLPDAAGSIIRFFVAETEHIINDIGVRIGGPGVVVAGAADTDEELTLERNLLSRQIISIGGGTNEMARNVIGERVLKMPREPAADRGVPLNEVARNRLR